MKMVKGGNWVVFTNLGRTRGWRMETSDNASAKLEGLTADDVDTRINYLVGDGWREG